MRRKQVMAVLLAVSMAAANAVAVPVETQAKIAAGEVGEVDSTDAAKVTLSGSVEGDEIIYVSDADVDEKTVTVAVDGEMYVAISKEEVTEDNLETLEDESVTLAKADFDENAAAIYLIPASVSGSGDAVTVGDVISVIVQIDSTAPTLSTFTLGDEGMIIKASAQGDVVASDASQKLTLGAEDTDGSGVDTIAYALGTTSKDEAALKAMADGDWTSYSDESGDVKVSLADGSNYIYVKLTDAVGNVTSN